jgi:hypothetical protein
MNSAGPDKKKSEKGQTTGSAKSFHFGSGRQYSASLRQKECIIHRSRTLPALFGRQAQGLSSRLPL